MERIERVNKLAIFSDFLSGMGGTEFYTVQLATLMKQMGLDVRVFTQRKPTSDTWLDILAKHNIPVEHSGLSYVDRDDKKPEQDLAARMVHIFNTDWKPDIIHACPLGEILRAWLETDHKKTAPLVGTEMTTPGADTSHWYPEGLIDHINDLDAIITWCHASEKGVRDYMKYMGIIEVIPHFVPEPQKTFEFITDFSNKSLGCISRLSPEKGLDYVIGAMSAVVKRDPEITLHIYGHGKELDRLKYLVSCLDLTNNVFFDGTYPPITGINDVAARHSVFIQPSLFESIPTSIIELIARKRVILTTKVGGNEELLENEKSGLLVDRASTDQIAEAIEHILIDNPEKQNEYSRAGYNRFRQCYNIENSLSRHLELYSRVTQK